MARYHGLEVPDAKLLPLLVDEKNRRPRSQFFRTRITPYGATPHPLDATNPLQQTASRSSLSSPAARFGNRPIHRLWLH
jgi:hypothetical protein